MKSRNITTILVCPENPDNIGAAARALKNMGFSDLRLVKPPKGWRVKAKKMAMFGADILRATKTFPSLAKASADLQVLIGTTRRISQGRGPFLDFGEAISRIKKDSEKLKIGLVFGCESKGLANKDSQLCDALATIPASQVYPSLNLAQAVMVFLFSVFSQKDVGKNLGSGSADFLNKKEVDITMRHFAGALKALGYSKDGARLLPRILQTMRGLVKRSGLLGQEAQMLKGLSRRIADRTRLPN